MEYHFGSCPYICNNKTELGYCKTSVCVNPKYNSFCITSSKTLTKEELEQIEKSIRERD